MLGYLAGKQLEIANLSNHAVPAYIRRHLNGCYTEHRLSGHVCLSGGIVALLRMFWRRCLIYWFRAKGLLAPAILLLSGRAVKDR